MVRLPSNHRLVYLPNYRAPGARQLMERSSLSEGAHTAMQTKSKLISAATGLGVVALLVPAGLFAAFAKTPTVAAGSPTTGSSAVINLGSGGWKVLTSATATQSGS